MRWKARPKKFWRPWFAFLPRRSEDCIIWLEPIWVRDCGEYSEWRPWNDMPNEKPVEPWATMYVEGKEVYTDVN